MADDNFRPRVSPARITAPAEPWPASPSMSDTGDLGNLLGPFDKVRRALDAQRAAEDELEGDHEPEPKPKPKPKPGMTFTADEARVRTAPTPVAATPPPPPQPTAPIPPIKIRGGKRHSGRGRIIAAVAVVGVLAFCAGVATVVGTRGQSGTPSASDPTAPSVAAPPIPSPTPDAIRAVAWVDSAVGPTHVVACDASVCALLHTHGFPTSSLVVASSLTGVEQADTVIMTSALRAQLGSAAATILAPEPLAVFGSGAGRVEVAAVALNGPDAYAQSMATDRASRRAAGNALLSNTHLIVDASARSLLAGGLVDTRVCALLALLAGSHTITLAGFVPLAPGAGPDVPSTGVVIETIDGEAATGSSTAATWLLSTVQAQQDPYRAISAAPGALNGQQGLRVVYSQPGPFGLLSGMTS